MDLYLVLYSGLSWPEKSEQMENGQASWFPKITDNPVKVSFTEIQKLICSHYSVSGEVVHLNIDLAYGQGIFIKVVFLAGNRLACTYV